MDIKELITEKEELERKIAKEIQLAINDFGNLTGASISNIEISFVCAQELGIPFSYILNGVRATIHLQDHKLT